MPRRSRAREVVLQVLYQRDLNPNPERDIETNVRFINGRLHHNQDLVDFAKSLLMGVLRNQEELDAELAKHADNWSLDRMAATDRNVLRLCAFELLFTETPHRVALNEAVELARRFGTRQSPPFVNGILDSLLKDQPESDNAP